MRLRVFQDNKVRATRLLAAMVMAVFLVAGLLSIGMGMPAKDMQGTACSLGKSGDSCLMDPGQHLTWWNQTFAQAQVSQAGHLLLALMGLFLFLGYVLLNREVFLIVLRRPDCPTKDPPWKCFHNYLLSFFAQGKAQPLLYA